MFRIDPWTAVKPPTWDCEEPIRESAAGGPSLTLHLDAASGIEHLILIQQSLSVRRFPSTRAASAFARTGLRRLQWLYCGLPDGARKGKHLHRLLNVQLSRGRLNDLPCVRIADESLRSSVERDGPLASIHLWWDEYPCGTPVSYELSMCRVGSKCFLNTTNVANYVMRSGPDLAVVLWNQYHVTVNGTCDGISVRLLEFYIDTGPGELLPLRKFAVVPEDSAVEVKFATPDERTQSAAEDIVVTICDVLSDHCLEEKHLPMHETGYRFEALENGNLYNVSAHLAKEVGNMTYTSQVLTISVSPGHTNDADYPPVENATVWLDQGGSEKFVNVTVSCTKPKEMKGKHFGGIFVQLFDAKRKLNFGNFSSESEQLMIAALPDNELFRVSVQAVYLDRKGAFPSVGRDIIFFTSGGDELEVGYNFTGEGPSAEIHLWWKDYPCGKGSVSYKLTACLGNICFNHSTNVATFVLKKGFAFPVLFWNTYHISIEATCGGSSANLRGLDVIARPGELLPLQRLRVIAERNAANLSYEKPNKLSQNVAENVEVIFCDILEPFCFPARKVPISEATFRLEDLEPGVLYNVSVSLTKEWQGKKYASQALSANFTTAHPDEQEYPPIENPFVEILSSQDGLVGITLNCSKPSDTRGKQFRGIFVELLNHRTKQKETFKAPGTHVTIPGLALYQTYTATLYAVYSEGHDSVQSAGRQVIFFTHARDALVPRPEFDKVFALNGTTALISWIHPATISSEFLFRITWKQSSNNDTTVADALPPQTRTFLLQNLEPEEKYAVFVTAYVQANRGNDNSSVVQEFTMLPRDALVPTLQVRELQPNNLLELTWEVLVSPEVQPYCHFLALACPEDGECEEKTIASNLRTSVLDVIPYTNYTVRVRTKCDFENEIHVFADSNLFQYNTSEVLAPVKQIRQHLVNLTTVILKWTVPANESVYTGFNVQWSQIGGDGFEESSFTQNPYFTLTDLHPASEYKVLVQGVRTYREQVFHSRPTSTIVHSGIETPPQLPYVNAEQVKFTKTAIISWPKVDFNAGPVEYEVMLTCPSGESETRWTEETQLRSTVSSITGYVMYCFVAVSPCTEDMSGDKNVCSPSTAKSFNFTSIKAPADVQVKYSAETIYDVTIVFPPELKELANLDYQITDESGEYGERIHRNIKATISDSRYDQPVDRKARLCVNDLCGEERRFNFVTNTGAPGMVTGLRVEVDATTLKLTWSKPEKSNGPIDGYSVSVTETGAGSTKKFNDLKETSLTVNMGREYTSYAVAVRAYNFDKEDKSLKKISLDSVATAFTKGSGPPPPSNLEALSSQGHSRIQWRATPHWYFNITWFRVFVDSAQDMPSTTFTQDPVFEFSSLKPYTVYKFEVSSCVQNEPATCGKPAKLEKRTDVGYPSAPRVMFLWGDSGFIAVEWTVPKQPVGPIDGYRYDYVDKSSGRTPSNWTTVTSEQRIANLCGLSPNTAYEIHVQAFNLNSEREPLYSNVGILVASTQGASTGAEWVTLLSVMAVLASCGLAYFGYTRYMRRVRETPLPPLGPQTHSSQVLQETDL